MSMGLDHCIHCVFHVWCLICYMIVCCVNNIHGKVYMEKRGTLGLENITLGVREKNEWDSSRCTFLLHIGTCTTSLTRREISKFIFDPYFFGILCITELLSDICRWLVEEEDVKAAGRATTNLHLPLTNEISWRLLVMRLLLLHRLVLWLPPLHMLVQMWAREG